MPRVGLEPMIPAFEWAKTVHSLDRAATVTGEIKEYGHKYFICDYCKFVCWLTECWGGQLWASINIFSRQGIHTRIYPALYWSGTAHLRTYQNLAHLPVDFMLQPCGWMRTWECRQICLQTLDFINTNIRIVQQNPELWTQFVHFHILLFYCSFFVFCGVEQVPISYPLLYNLHVSLSH
jgi:hypothetical protein